MKKNVTKIKLLEKIFIDAHDYQGTMTLMLTIAGDANDLDKEYLCTAMVEHYVRSWGFHIRDLKFIAKCFYDTEKKRVTRVLTYEKTFPPRYKGIFFNQLYTDKVRKQVEKLREVASGYMRTDLDIG